MTTYRIASRERWNELSQLVDRAHQRGVKSLPTGEVKRLCRLYRQVIVDLSHARTGQEDPELVRYLNTLAARAHGQVYGAERVDIRPVFGFVTSGFPRLVRTHARPILVAVFLFVLTSLASFLAVVRDPQTAYSLYDEHVVEFENIRLERKESEYRGNFTFSVSESPLVAVLIIGNNIWGAIMAFGLGALCCVPGLLLLAYNGRMLGTLAGLVWNRSYSLDFWGLILTHGVLELTAICIAAGAGFHLGWSVIAPGRLTRRAALRRARPAAFGLLAGTALMLVVAGVIEAYVTPHFSASVRWSVAAGSALFLVLYFGFAGRGSSQKRPERDFQVAVD